MTIILICNEKKSRIKNSIIVKIVFFKVILETSTVITFAHGVAQLPRAPQIGWSFYITICMAVFTLMFFFILLLTTFCCKLLITYLSLSNRKPRCKHQVFLYELIRHYMIQQETLYMYRKDFQKISIYCSIVFSNSGVILNYDKVCN